MIIELHSEQADNIYFTAWDIPEYYWQNKKDVIMTLFLRYFSKYNIQFSQNEWQNNIIFHLPGDQSEFNRVEKVFNQYFSTIKVLNIVN